MAVTRLLASTLPVSPFRFLSSARSDPFWRPLGYHSAHDQPVPLQQEAA